MLRWSTRWRRAALSHNRGSLDTVCPIPPPLMPFFWVVNDSMTKLAAWRSLAVAVVAKTLWLQLKAVYLRRNRMLSDLYPVYYPVQRRKK